MRLQVGTILKGRYEIISEIGEGGFGSIVKAQDLALNRYVALKILKSDTLDAQQLAERFQRESRLLAQLVHRNILSVYSYELTEDSTPFIVMEYLEGSSLADILRKKGTGLDYQDCKNIFMQICQGLAFAHKQGVVHRDLGASNIMITSGEYTNNNVKILDFGLAKITQSNSTDSGSRGNTITKTGALLGNPSYLSPEGCRGQKVDHVSDIYSLGCLLYEMLGGKRPFDSWDVMTLLVQHQTEYPAEPQLNWNNPEAESQFKSVALLCMQKERERRPQSMDNIISFISDKLDLEPFLKKADLWGQSRGAKKQRVPFAAIAVSILVAATLSAVLLNKTLRSKREEAVLTTRPPTTSDAEKKLAERVAQLKRHSRNSSALIDPLCQLAQLYYKDEQTDKAEASFEELLRLLRKDPDTDTHFEVGVVNLLAECKNKLRKYKEEEKLIREGEALELKRRGYETTDYAVWIMLLARNLEEQKRYEEAEKEYKRAFKIYDLNEDKPAFINGAVKTGRFYKKQRRYNEAIVYYEKAIKAIKREEEVDTDRLVETQVEMARILRLSGNEKKAELFLQEAIASAKSIKDPALLAKALELASSVRNADERELLFGKKSNTRSK